MAWILSVTTLLSNANLGWSKGAWWSWALWAANAGLWQVYAMSIHQYGLTPLNLVTMGMGAVNAYRKWSESHREDR